MKRWWRLTSRTLSPLVDVLLDEDVLIAIDGKKYAYTNIANLGNIVVTFAILREY